MKIPLGSNYPTQQQKELFSKLGFNVNQIHLEDKYYVIDVPQNRRIQVNQEIPYSDPYGDHREITVYFNGIKVIEVKQKIAEVDAWVLFNIYPGSIEDALKIVDADMEVESKEIKPEITHVTFRSYNTNNQIENSEFHINCNKPTRIVSKNHQISEKIIQKELRNETNKPLINIVEEKNHFEYERDTVLENINKNVTVVMKRGNLIVKGNIESGAVVKLKLGNLNVSGSVKDNVTISSSSYVNIANNIGNNCKIKLVNGSMKTRTLGSGSSLYSCNGDIEVAIAKSNSFLETINGKINVENVEENSVLKSVNGKINAVNVDSSCILKTVNGNISVIKKDKSASLITVNGDIIENGIKQNRPNISMFSNKRSISYVEPEISKRYKK